MRPLLSSLLFSSALALAWLLAMDLAEAFIVPLHQHQRRSPSSCNPHHCQQKQQMALSIRRRRGLSMLSESTPPPNKEFISQAVGPAEIEKLWTESKTLLRLGKGGVKGSHINSLSELLQAHSSLRVKVNDSTANLRDVAEKMLAPKEEGQEALGVLLRVKGREFMVARADTIANLPKS